MYLHVGNNETVRVDRIVGIFDADSATVSAVTKQFLSASQAKGNVRFAAMELPKSFVLYQASDGDYRICFSQLSAQALVGRVEHPKWKEILP